MYDTYVKRIRVKDPKPEFSGRTFNSRLIKGSEDFIRFSTRWGYDEALFSTVEFGVSDHLKRDRDHMNDGIDPETLCEAHDALHGLRDATGSSLVKQLIV